mgnify:CR=1 FL=1
MVSNPNKYSEMNTGGSLGDIRDNDDFPHTGLIKALSSGMGQNYAISGFDASSINATAVTNRSTTSAEPPTVCASLAGSRNKFLSAYENGNIELSVK